MTQRHDPDDAWEADAGSRPLEGLKVVDLGQYLAGPMAAVLLADQGAGVTRIDPLSGPRWETPANLALLRRRRRLRLNLRTAEGQAEVRRLIDDADVVVENFRPGVTERLGVGAAECLARNPRLVYCSMPGFGHDDLRAGQPGWEGVVLAAAAAYATGSAEMLAGEWWPTDGPAFSPLLLGSVFAAIQGAMGVTAALVAREHDGLGQHVEAPLHDAFLEAIGARALRYEHAPPAGGATLGSGVYRCADDRYVSLITVNYRHLEWFVRAADVGDWIDDGLVDFDQLMSDPQAAGGLSRRLVALLATRPAHEWERIGRDAGVPLAAMCSSREWLREEHARASGAIRDMDDPNLGRVGVPGPAVEVREQRSAGVPAVPRVIPGATQLHGPLAGLRVLDMSRVLAAPSASRLLADLGADVVKADADLTDARLALRQPVFHEQTNRGKRTVELDLATSEGRRDLRQLLEWADVLITNFTLPRLAPMGLDEESVRWVAPDLVYVYLNAFGTRGPWADRRGYAEIANTATGITERTIGVGPPSGAAPTIDLPRCPFTDYAAGGLAAFAALTAWYRRLRGGGALRAETSLVRAACWLQLPYLIDHETQAWDEPRPPAPGWNDAHRLYRTQDGWVAVGLDPAAWERLCEQHAGNVGEGLAQGAEHWFAAMTTGACVSAVRDVGGGAHEVVDLDTLMAPGGPADRRGLRLAQQSDEFGTVVQPGPTVRFSRTSMRAGALPGPFGSDGTRLSDVLAGS